MFEDKCDILITDAIIITNDDAGVVKCADIAITGEKISYVGNSLSGHCTAAYVIDGKDKVVMPGLVNAHTHIGMTVLRSFADDMPLWAWLKDIIWPAEDQLTGQDIYWSSMLGIAEMIMSGITCFADMYFFTNYTAKAVQQSGIRALISRGLQDNDGKGEQRLQENVALFEEYNDYSNGRIKVALGPHAPYTCSVKYLNNIADKAFALGCSIHIHLSETQKEVSDSIKQYGKSPVEYVRESGIFELNTIAAHCTNVCQQDIDILKKHKVNVVYNPSSNLKLCSGFAPVNEFIQKGINVSIGTDSAASNNNLNMFEEMHIASLINKALTKQSTALDANTTLSMATLNGAYALGMDNIGRIKKGWKADIIMLDLNKPHMNPSDNIISNIIYCAQASDVDTVIVNGNILMQNKELKTIDLERVLFETNKIRQRLKVKR